MPLDNATNATNACIFFCFFKQILSKNNTKFTLPTSKKIIPIRNANGILPTTTGEIKIMCVPEEIRPMPVKPNRVIKFDRLLTQSQNVPPISTNNSHNL